MSTSSYQEIANQPPDIRPYFQTEFWDGHRLGEGSPDPDIPYDEIPLRDRICARNIMNEGANGNLGFTPLELIPHDATISYSDFPPHTALALGIERITAPIDACPQLPFTNTGPLPLRETGTQVAPRRIYGNQVIVEIDVLEGIVVATCQGRHVLRFISRREKNLSPVQLPKAHTDFSHSITIGDISHTRSQSRATETLARVIGARAYTIDEKNALRKLGTKLLSRV